MISKNLRKEGNDVPKVIVLICGDKLQGTLHVHIYTHRPIRVLIGHDINFPKDKKKKNISLDRT